MQKDVDNAIPGHHSKSVGFQGPPTNHGSKHITVSWLQTTLSSHLLNSHLPVAAHQDPSSAEMRAPIIPSLI
eukprot:1787683-Karenia_brevis.AAC.1